MNTYKHIKTGRVYDVIDTMALIESKGPGSEPQVVYKSVADGTVWIRPRHEFFDGRFKALA